MTDVPDDLIFVRMDVNLPNHPKLIDASPEAKWLYVTSWCISGRNLTDGVVRPRVAAAEADVDASTGDELVEIDVWHKPGHKCKSCPEPPRGHVVIHDYLDHNRSRAEVEQLKAKRSEAGKKGADRRWGKASAKASAIANGEANRWQADGKRVANLSPDTDTDTDTSSSLDVDSNPLGSTARELTDTEVARITKLTGGGPAHARKTVGFILDHAPADVAKPMAYVLAAIRNDPDAYRYRRGNPKRDQECPDHPGQWADRCAACRADQLYEG